MVGVDISSEQIQADTQANETLNKPTLLVLDARTLHLHNEFRNRFDFVIANWLYDTAIDAEELYEMAYSVRQCLRSQGKHLGLEVNFNIRPSEATELENFGISLMPDKPKDFQISDGSLFRARIDVGPSEREAQTRDMIVTDVTFYSESTYRRVFREAGLKEVKFKHPDRWDQRGAWLDRRYKEKFTLYVKSNPEMISFSAVA